MGQHCPKTASLAQFCCLTIIVICWTLQSAIYHLPHYIYPHASGWFQTRPSPAAKPLRGGAVSPKLSGSVVFVVPGWLAGWLAHPPQDFTAFCCGRQLTVRQPTVRRTGEHLAVPLRRDGVEVALQPDGEGASAGGGGSGKAAQQPRVAGGGVGVQQRDDVPGLRMDTRR